MRRGDRFTSIASQLSIYDLLLKCYGELGKDKIEMSITERKIPISIDSDAIAQLCQKYYIRKLSLFGSVLRSDFCSTSDVDMLVEFEPNRTPGFGFIDVQEQLSEIIGCEVDLNTPKSLSRYFREQVLASARAIYVKP